MPIEVPMPALSPTMEKGTLARWLVKEGDVVAAGALLAEVETDKATMEMEASEGGVITRLLIPEGTEDVCVGSPVALLALLGEGPPCPAALPTVVKVAPLLTLEPTPPPTATPAVAERLALLAELPEGRKASPLARRIARAAGVDLSTLKGSGTRGKIIAADVGVPASRDASLADFPAVKPAASLPPLAPAGYAPSSTPHQVVALSTMRKIIARRLTEAKQSVPHFYLGMDMRMDALFALRTELNAASGEGGLRVSVNDLMIKALASALEDTPDANVQFADDRLLRFSRVDVSMAVAVPGGLVTPVIQDASGKRLSRIASETKALATRAREGKLSPEDYEGGTVSISNLGMFGVTQMTPVINPPQALILGVPAAADRACYENGQISSARIVSVTASFDHRAIDGAIGAALLARLKYLIEHPLNILT